MNGVKTYSLDVNSYDFIRVTVATLMLFTIILMAYKAILSRETEILKFCSESVFVINQGYQSRCEYYLLQ